MAGEVMEQWKTIQAYQQYSVSTEGRVRSDRSGAILAISRSGGSRPFVKLSHSGSQISKGVALLVCTTFVPMPQRPMDVPTPIHLDGDLTNCRADNLLWRPRWFAQKHTTQFQKNLDNPHPVYNIDTGKVYRNIWDVVFEHGVLFNDVLMSIVNKTYVYPLFQCFEWAERT